MSFDSEMAALRRKRTVQTATLSRSVDGDGDFNGKMAKLRQQRQYRETALGGEDRETDAKALETWATSGVDLMKTIESGSQKWYDADQGVRWSGALDRYLKGAESWKTKLAGNKEVTDYLDSFIASLNEAKDFTSSWSEYYGQWGSDADYQKALKEQEESQKQYQAMVDYDTGAAQTEIDSLEKELKEYKSWAMDRPTDEVAAKYREFGAKYGSGSELERLIDQKKIELNDIKTFQRRVAFSSVADPGSENYDQSFGSLSGHNSEYDDDGLYKLINASKEEKMKYVVASANSNANGPVKTLNNYSRMTEDEIAVFNYYYAKQGSMEALKYLSSLQPVLEDRVVNSQFEKIQGKMGLELLFGVSAGLDQFTSGVQNLFSTKDYIPVTSTQKLSDMVREDLVDVGYHLPEWMGGASFGQAAYDTVTTTANMAPSILASTAANMVAPGSGAIVGNTLMFASSAGNAYQEALNVGYSKGQARAYSTLIGGSEAGLQYLLGGIGKLGGKVSGNAVTKMLDGVDNAFWRVAGKVGGNMLSEGMEEGIQEILTPYFKNLTLHTDESVDWGQVAYSGLLGAITAGALEGPGAVVSGVKTRNTGVKLQKAGITAQRLAELGSLQSADSVAYRLAGKVNEKTGAYAMGRMFHELGAEITAHDQVEIQSLLEQKGVSSKDAKVMAEGFAHVVVGGELTAKQQALIQANEDLAGAVYKAIVEPNSTVYQRSQGYNEALMALAKEKVGMTPTAKAEGADAAPAENNVSTPEKPGAEGGSQAPVKAKVDQTGPAVKQVKSVADGKMILELEDGSEVDAADAVYRSADEALVYETVAAMGVNASAANLLADAYKLGTVPAEVYARGIQEAYKHGQYGAPVSDLNTGVAAQLTDHQKQTAYKLGALFGGTDTIVQEYLTYYNAGFRGQSAENVRSSGRNLTQEQKIKAWETGAEDARKSLKKGKSSAFVAHGEEAGVVSSPEAQELMRTEPRVYKAMQRLARDLGIKIMFADISDSINGKIADGVVWLNKNALEGDRRKRTIARILAHEVTHRLKEIAPEAYAAYRDYVLEQAAQTDLEGVIREYRERCSEIKLLSNEEAMDEIAADYTQDLLGDAKQFRSFLEESSEHQNWGKKLIEGLKYVVDRVKKTFRSQSYDTDMGSVEQALALWEKAYAEGKKTVKKAPANGKGEIYRADGDTAYSISQNFAKQLENWDGKTTGFSFVLGNTSDALIQAGIPNKQIRWDASKIKTVLEKHDGMTLNIMKQVPGLLEDPVVVIESKHNDQARIVMGELYDTNGKIVTAVLLLTPTSKKGNQLDIIKIASAQGRSHIESLFRKKDGSEVTVCYVDKKRIQSWLNANRLQLPLRSFNVDPTTSLSDGGGNVKSGDENKADYSVSGTENIIRGNYPVLKEWEVQTAVYEVLASKRGRHDPLVKLGKLPSIYSKLIGSNADIYVRGDHLYENTVDKGKAVADGRLRKNAHYHGLGAETVIDAIMALEEPAMLIEDRVNENPTIVALLPKSFGDGGIYAAMSFYSAESINGSFERRPHVVLTLSPIPSASQDGRKSLETVINDAVRDKTVLYIDKKTTETLPVNAQNVNLGIVTDASVKNSLSRFQKEVKRFKEENRIDYSVSGTENILRGKISQTELDSIQSIDRKSINQFTSDEIRKTERFSRRYWEQMGTKSPFFRAWFGDWRAHDKSPVQIADQLGNARGIQKNQDTGWNINVSGFVFNETKVHTDSPNKSARKYLDTIDDIVRKAVLLDSYSIPKEEAKSPNSLLMHSLYAVADVGSGPEILKLYVEEMNDPNGLNTAKRAYQLQNVEKYRLLHGVHSNTASSISAGSGVVTVADLFAAVKSRDAAFSPKPVDPILLNEDGTPKKFYHGTRVENGDFTVFDSDKAVKKGGLGLKAMGKGNYFTAKKLDGTERYGGRVIAAYLSIKKPFVYEVGGKSITEQFSEKEGVSTESFDELQQAMRDKGYDGVVQYAQDDSVSIAVTFDSTQIKSAMDNIGTFDGADSDIRYSISGTEEILDRHRKKYGVIQPGEDPVRSVAMPKKVDPKRRVSMTVRTALEAGVTPDILVPKIEEAVIAGAFSSEVQKNKDRMEMARKWLEETASTEKALESWQKDVAGGSMDADTEVRGYLLYDQLATEASRTADVALQEKYVKQAIDILTDITNMVRENARAVQAARILKKMEPEGKYHSLERAVQNLNDKLLKDTADFKLEKGREKLEIDRELAWAWMRALHAGDQAGAKLAEEALYKDIASQVKRTFWDRWHAWRYLSMLGNFKTLGRNFVGNLAMVPAKFTKDKIAAGLELAFVRDKSKRTKYMGTTHTMRGEALRSFAKGDYALVSELLGDAGKYSTRANTKLLQAIREYKSKFQAIGLKQYQGAVDWMMNGKVLGDSMFMKKHYTASFAGIAMARGWTAEQIKSGRISQEALDEARSIAFKEAQKAAFRDVNALSGAVRKWHFKAKKDASQTAKRAAQFGNVWLDATLPFRATPANVLVRAVEYSPLELAYNLVFGTADVVRGKISASEYIDHWATGLTGTGVYLLGMLLAGLGLIKGGGVDDDEKREGYQQYGLQIGDKTYSLDWLSPMAIPLFMGVESYDAVVEPLSEGEDLDLGGALTAIGKAFQPMLEMSCLSGVTSMLDTMTYVGEADAWQLMYAVFISPFISYVGQLIPTLSSQTASAFEKQGEKTYVSDIEDQAERNITYDLVKLLEKIPGSDWRQVPRVDAWGRVDEGNGWAESFLSPAYVSDISVTEADQEIDRLKIVFQEQIDELNVKYSKATTQAEKAEIRKEITRLGELMDVSPDLAGTKIGDVRLTQEEYTAYALAKGQNNFELASAMIGSYWYKGLSDEQKSDALRKAYDLADARGKSKAVGLVKSDWTEDLLDCDTETAIAGIQGELEENWAESAKKDANAELKAAILSGGNATSAVNKLKGMGKSDDDIRTYAKSTVTEAYKTGQITESQALSYYKRYGGMTGEDAVDKVAYCKYQMENPQYADLSQKAALMYHRSLKSMGVDLGEFYEVYKACSKLSTKSEVMEYLDEADCGRTIRMAIKMLKGYK